MTRRIHSAGIAHSSPPSYQHMLDKLASHSENIEAVVMEKLKHKLLASAYSTHGPDLMHLFETIDKDKSGSIAIDELAHTVRRLVPDLSEDEIQTIMNTADKNGNGQLQFEEFCEFIGHRDSAEDTHNHHYLHQHYQHTQHHPAHTDSSSSSSSSSSSPKAMLVDRGTTLSSSSHGSRHTSPAPVSYIPSSSRHAFVQLETRSTSPFASNVLKNILGDDYIPDAEFADDIGKSMMYFFIDIHPLYLKGTILNCVCIRICHRSIAIIATQWNR